MTGPIVHHFYLFLDYLVPKDANYIAIKKLLIDRLGFAPAFMFLFFYVMALLEVRGIGVTVSGTLENS